MPGRRRRKQPLLGKRPITADELTEDLHPIDIAWVLRTLDFACHQLVPMWLDRGVRDFLIICEDIAPL